MYYMNFDHGGDVYAGKRITLDFSVSLNPLGMPEKVRAAVASCAAACVPYPDPFCRELSEGIARHEGVKSCQVLCGAGAAALIYRLCLAARPKNALTLAPTFSEYENAVRLSGGETRAHLLREEEGFAVTPRVLKDIAPGVDMLFLCNPNNPTGRLLEPSLMDAALKKCAALNIPLCVDESFLPFTSQISLSARLSDFPNLLVLKSFTKLYSMAGLRLGYIMSANAAHLSRIRDAGAPWEVSAPAQAAGLAALECDIIAPTLRLIGEERRYLSESLSALGCEVVPGDANFLLFSSPVALYAPMLERGFLLRSCDSFAGLGARYFRVGIKTRRQNEALLQALGEALHG